MILSFIILGCDPERYYDYLITNNCNEFIEVKIIDGHDKNLNFQIEPRATKLVYSYTTCQPLDSQMIELIESFFKEIVITKENDISKVNYINIDLWDFKATSKFHANIYLTINPEDFD
jgi:hypothetical protein